MAHTTSRGHGGKGGWQLKPMDSGMIGNGTTEYNEVSWINERILQLVPSLKDASDFEATNVPDNLYLITLNHNNLSSSDELGYSQHMNGFNKIARGVEVWYFLGDALGKELAEKASAAIAKALGIPNRGAKATTDLYVVRNTYATFLLFEWIFLDNKEDYEAWMKNRDKAVVAALKAIGYENISGGGSDVKPTPKPPQGDWIAENKKIEINTKNQNTYSGFDWKVRKKTNDIMGKQYKVTGKYNHENKETYYSLYDLEGNWHGYINKKFVKEISVIYQDVPGLYECLKTDNVYLDKELNKKSSLKVTKGQTLHLEDIVKVGKYTRAKIRINNDVRYVTMRDDFWKLIYKTKEKKIK